MPKHKRSSRVVVVVIETPKGSRNKYAFDPRERIFSLTKVLPAGIEFPYDFGFVPSTKDCDPLDALVLTPGTHSFTHVKHIDALGEAFEKELEDFFVNHHELSGKKSWILGVKGPGAARRRALGRERISIDEQAVEVSHAQGTRLLAAGDSRGNHLLHCARRRRCAVRAP